MQDDNVPQQRQLEFVRVHTTHVDLDTVVSKSPGPITITKAAVSLMIPIIRSALEGRRSLNSLMKPMTAVAMTAPDAIPIEISSSEVDVKTSSGSNALELPVERSLEGVSTETEDEQNYPDPDFLNCYWAFLLRR